MRKERLAKLIEKLQVAEVVVFCFIALFALAYYHYGNSHRYFNAPVGTVNPSSTEAIVATLAAYVWIVSACAMFIFPLMLIAQIVILTWCRQFNRKNKWYTAILAFLFLVNMAAALSFFSISKHQSIIKRKNLEHQDTVNMHVISKPDSAVWTTK